MFSFFCHLQKLFRLLSAWCVIFKSSCPPHAHMRMEEKRKRTIKKKNQFKVCYMFTKWAAGKIQAALDGQCSAIKITTFISGRSDQICSSSVILVLYELQFVIGSTKMLDYSLCVVSFFISLFNPLHSLLWWKTGNGLQLQLSCNFNIKGAQITYSHWWTWMQNTYFVLYKLNISGVVPNHTLTFSTYRKWRLFFASSSWITF